MKKKYTYRFRDGATEIETTEKWYSALREADRLERNKNIIEQHKTVHYEAFGFEPSFMAQEDDDPLVGIEGEPAYEYAMKQLPPRAREMIKRRILNHETYAVIGAAYGIGEAAAGNYIRRHLIRFRKFYEDGKWINSPANIDIPGSGKALTIPYKLTPEQVLAVRKLRSKHYSLNEIAKIVNIAGNQVLICLMENPVYTTVCPECGKLIKQSNRTKMHTFCDYTCYKKWYRNNGADKEAAFPPLRNKTYVSSFQGMAIKYYKQMFVAYKDMACLIGLPVRTISSYFNTKPLPYNLCANCGNRIYYEKTHNKTLNNRIVKFCSQKCSDAYHWRGFYAKTYKGIVIYHEPIIPFYDQLVAAIKWKMSGVSDELVCSCSGMSKDDIQKLFLYDDMINPEFLTEDELKKIQIPVIVTGKVRIVENYISSPLKIEGMPEIYAATLLIRSDDEKTIAGIELALDEAIRRGMPGLSRPFPNKEKITQPFDKHQIVTADSTSQSYYLLHVSNYRRPAVLNRKGKELDDPVIGLNDDVVVEVEFYPYRINAKRYGIGCRFWVVQVAERNEGEAPDYGSYQTSHDTYLAIQYDIS